MSSMRLAALFAAILVARTSVAQVRTIFVPGIWVKKAVISPPAAFPPYTRLDLLSRLALQNVGGDEASVYRVESYGPDGPYLFPDGAVMDPGQSGRLLIGDENAVQMGKYVVTGRVAVTARLELTHVFFVGYDCAISSGSTSAIRQGRLPLPIFDRLFPAGSTVVSGDVVPFNIGPPPFPCGQEYARRINVTLFNAGTVPATFTVKAHRAGTQDPLFVFETSYEVPSETVRQFNSIYTPQHLPDEYDGHNPNLWFTITGDQPFLSYISTTFEDPQPGAIQFEIFPSVLE